jgi:uncharacterized iron-regulated membrane protein
MTTARRFWDWTHTWSSLVCTACMLVVCLTGLPLIFSDEIAGLNGRHFVQAELPADAPRASTDAVAAAALAQVPGKVPLYLFAEADEPSLWYVKLDTRVDTDERHAVLVAVDARDASVLGLPAFDEGFMAVMYRLHVDLFAGMPGKLFLGLMGLLLVVAIVSGVVLYPPYMRKLEFGTVRHTRGGRIRWLDLHNLLGMVTLCWALVVGVTGVVNTWADLILKAWQQEQMARLASGDAARVLDGDATTAAAARQGGESQFALQQALCAAPDLQLEMMAWPGTLLSTKEHFAVILRGDTPLTSELREALLVDPQTGDVLRAGERPWYVTLFQLSQPLHFGDYGQLPLKLLWAALDLMTIVLLGSGVYLWIARRRREVGARQRLVGEAQ